MPINVTCPSCQQVCAVQDQHAGMQVRCPKCSATIEVPKPAFAEPVIPVAAPAEPAPAANSGNVMASLTQSATALGLDPLSTRLVFAALGCMALMVLATFFPWVTISFDLGGFAPGKSLGSVSSSALGIQIWTGILQFLFTLAAGGFVAATLVFLKRADLFNISLWVAGGWNAIIALWRLIDVARVGRFWGIGLYLSLLAALAAAGMIGYVAVQRQMKK